jgi:hypothetical protein
VSGTIVKVIFLDIDGVLNTGAFDLEAESSSIDRLLVARLRRVLAATGAKIVLCSSWRYLVLEGAMTLSGFEYLLRTHGMPKGCLVGLTAADEAGGDRGAQILRWVAEHGPLEAWAVLDDVELQLAEEHRRHVRTRREEGLSDGDAEALVRILAEGAP